MNGSFRQLTVRHRQMNGWPDRPLSRKVPIQRATTRALDFQGRAPFRPLGPNTRPSGGPDHSPVFGLRLAGSGHTFTDSA
jgi:hypothetical protein